MTGQPGNHTMEMDGGSAVSYLTRTPLVPLLMLSLIGLEAKGFKTSRGDRDHFHCAVEPLPGHIDGRVLIRSWCWDLIVVTGTSGKKNLSPAEKPKSVVYTQKSKTNRCLGIWCWDPNLIGGYQNCGLGIHGWDFFQNRSGRNSNFSREFSGV